MYYTGDSAARRVSTVSQAGAPQSGGIAFFLEKNSGQYDAGDVIKGHVELNLQKELKVKGMRLQFSGAARVSLDNEKTTQFKGISIDKKCKNFELILDHKVQLLKKDTNQLLAKPNAPGGRKRSIFSCTPLMDDTDFVIPAGVNRYPFEFALPRNLPSSYEGRWGSIQYVIKLTIEKFNDIERLFPFSVRGLVDLNEDLDLLKPVSTASSASYSRMCSCARKDLTVNLSIAKRAYLPGEQVWFIAEVINESHKKLKNVKISLVQQVTCRTGVQTKKSTSVLQAIQGGPLAPRQTKRWDQEILHIPQDSVPTSVCKSIQIKYVLIVNIHIGLMDDDLNLPLPFIVGTVQFKPTAAQRHLMKLRQTDPGIQSILAQFAECGYVSNQSHRESVATVSRQNSAQVSRQNSAQGSLTVPNDDVSNGRRYSTGSGYEASGKSSHKRMSSADAKSLTVADARKLRTSNSDLTGD